MLILFFQKEKAKPHPKETILQRKSVKIPAGSYFYESD